jgi:hypothetical protein
MAAFIKAAVSSGLSTCDRLPRRRKGGILMKYLLGISYVNRADLLYKAIDSIEHYWPHTIIIDNSEGRDLRHDRYVKDRVRVYEPPVPLTVPQKMNYLQELAESKGCDVLLHMHNDAEAPPGVPEAFLKVLEGLLEKHRSGHKWGIAFTSYDYLMALNMDAVRAVGPWDTTFTQYFSDNDYYWRLHAGGYEHIWTGIGVIHHGSATVNSNPYLKQIFDTTFPLYHLYYKQKWGGQWFKEKYRCPFTPTAPWDILTYPPNWKFP